MRKLLIAALLCLAGASPSLAACYEDIGCTDTDLFSRSDLRRLSCDALWEVRNEIYFANGYCFKTERGLDFFGDEDCEHEEMGDVPLSRMEIRNIARISEVEKQKQCN
jgi:hypothetical protein